MSPAAQHPTSPPSIAEIVWRITSKPCGNRIRWDVSEAAHRACEELGCTEYRSADGRVEYSLSNFGEPTVDDMLAWLAERGWCTNIEYLNAIDRHPTPVIVRLRQSSFNVIDLPMDVTLRGALEAAVRAVTQHTKEDR